jgi:hypothetical protein
MEKWKQPEGLSKYRVSNKGRVKSFFFSEEGRILKQVEDNNGYLRISLTNDNRERKTYKVHRLVGKAFIPNPYNKPEINHIDCNKKNNKVENLEWVTSKENMRHAYNEGLLYTPQGIEKENSIPIVISNKLRDIASYGTKVSMVNDLNLDKETINSCIGTDKKFFDELSIREVSREKYNDYKDLGKLNLPNKNLLYAYSRPIMFIKDGILKSFYSSISETARAFNSGRQYIYNRLNKKYLFDTTRYKFCLFNRNLYNKKFEKESVK